MKNYVGKKNNVPSAAVVQSSDDHDDFLRGSLQSL